MFMNSVDGDSVFYLLDQLDANKFTLDIDSKTKDIIPKKRSSFRNFLSRVVHIIFCKCFRRNGKLDKITDRILREAEKFNDGGVIPSEIERAMQKLLIVVLKNGGSRGEQVNDFLEQTIDKVKDLDAVKRLKNNDLHGKETKEAKDTDAAAEREDEVETDSSEKRTSVINLFPPIQDTDDVKLQNLLQNLFDRKADDHAVFTELVKLLPQLKSSVDLTGQQLEVLGRGLKHFNEGHVDYIFKNSPPQLITFIARCCLQCDSGSLFANLFNYVLKDSQHKENLSAFIRGFPAYQEKFRPQGDYYDKMSESRKLHGQHIHLFSAFQMLLDQNWLSSKMSILENRLSDDDFNYFLESFFGFIAIQQTLYNLSEFSSSKFVAAFDLLSSCSEKRKSFISRILCQTTPARCLVHVIAQSQPEDHLIETILKLNPPVGKDQFFEEFISQMNRYDFTSDLLSNIVDTILKNETEARKITLISHLPSAVVPFLKQIPSDIFEKIPARYLIGAAKAVRALPDEDMNNKILPFILKGFEKEPIKDFITNVEFYTSLLPHFSAKKQAELLACLIQARAENYVMASINELYQDMLKLPKEIWEEASKQVANLKLNALKKENLPISHLAALVSGQRPNQQFLQNFFATYFDHSFVTVQQQEFLNHLNPLLFSYDESTPNYMCIGNAVIWERFLKALISCPETEHSRNLLVAVSQHLFNRPAFKDLYVHCLKALTPNELARLPLENCNPEIRLFIASKTGRLNDSILGTVNELTPEQENIFLQIFEFDFSNREKLAELFSWLAKVQPPPRLLTTLSQKMISDYPYDISSLDLPHDVLINLVEYATDHQLVAIVKIIKGQKARELIEKRWKEVAARVQRSERNDYTATEILKMVDGDEKRLEMLINVASHCETSITCYDHLNRHPWKLVLVSASQVSRPHYERDSIPIALEVIGKYWGTKTKDQCAQLNQQLKTYFTLAQEKKFPEAKEFLKTLPKDIKKYLTIYALNKDKVTSEIFNKKLCKDLPYLNDGQIFAALIKKKTRKNIEEALQYGISVNQLTPDERRKQYIEKILSQDDIDHIQELIKLTKNFI